MRVTRKSKSLQILYERVFLRGRKQGPINLSLMTGITIPFIPFARRQTSRFFLSV